MTKSRLIRGVKKIAVFRATALGDLIFALPALNAIHQSYPQAEIVYLGRAWHAAFLPGRADGVQRVLAVPPAQGSDIEQGRVIDPRVERAFLAEMQAEHFDLAFQMQGGGGYSNPFVRALGARVTIGAKAPAADPLDRWIPYTYYQSEVARLLEITALAGTRAAAASLQPNLRVLGSDLAAAAPLLAGVDGPFAVLHPGSTDPRRCWSADKFARVGDALAQKYGLRVVLTGVEREGAILSQVERAMQTPALNLCGQLSLDALVGVLTRAKIIIANDTGPLHLALAVGTKAVGLFWGEYVVNSLPLTRSSFLPLIDWQRTCPRCNTFVDKAEADQPTHPRCQHDLSFIERITPEQVLAEADVLLGE